MKTRKSFTVLLAAAALMTGLSALTAPVMATAKPYNGHIEARVDNRIDSRISNLQDRIRMGENTRQLSHREATRLTTKLNGIKATKRSFERSGHGLNGQETATLNARLDTLSGQIRIQNHDNNRR